MRSIARGGLVLLGLVVATAGPLPVVAQTEQLQIEQRTIDALFFHVFVKGEAQSPHVGERWGKAFAVGPDLLITARHVIGDPQEWMKKTGGKAGIMRAVRPLVRKITLTSRHSGEIEKLVFAQPAPSHTVGATGLFVPGLELDSYLHLSMCKIVKENLYTALMTSENPKIADESVENVKMIKLKAKGYEPDEFGALYVFDVEDDGQTFQSEPDGHEGSPILNDDGDVVAIVSAVVLEGVTKVRILATPIQPHFPGTMAMLTQTPDQSTERSRKVSCSIADTVQRIHKEVSQHVTWTVDVKSKNYFNSETNKRELQVARKIFLSYENISAEPNILYVDVYVKFFGVDAPYDSLLNDNNPKTEKIGVDLPNQGKITLEETISDGGRKFVTEEIGKWGRKLVVPWVEELSKEKGKIEYVELKLVPFFKTDLAGSKPLSGKATVLEIPWK